MKEGFDSPNEQLRVRISASGEDEYSGYIIVEVIFDNIINGII